MDEKTYLAHFGIKGMKWGIRRTPEQLGHKKKKTLEPEHKRLSDEELQIRLKRLRMEDEYIRLTKNTRPISKGEKIVKNVLKATGVITATYAAVEKLAKIGKPVAKRTLARFRGNG